MRVSCLQCKNFPSVGRNANMDLLPQLILTTGKREEAGLELICMDWYFPCRRPFLTSRIPNTVAMSSSVEEINTICSIAQGH